MLVARAVAIACLTVFGWLLWALTLLLLVYLVMGWRSGDPEFKLTYLGLLGAGALFGGFLCRHLARRIERGS
jgi:hypothetical protein